MATAVSGRDPRAFLDTCSLSAVADFAKTGWARANYHFARDVHCAAVGISILDRKPPEHTSAWASSTSWRRGFNGPFRRRRLFWKDSTWDLSDAAATPVSGPCRARADSTWDLQRHAIPSRIHVQHSSPMASHHRLPPAPDHRRRAPSRAAGPVGIGYRGSGAIDGLDSWPRRPNTWSGMAGRQRLQGGVAGGTPRAFLPNHRRLGLPPAGRAMEVPRSFSRPHNYRT